MPNYLALLLSLALLLLSPPTATAAEDLVNGEPELQRAIRTSLSYLERDGTAWMDGTIPIQEGQRCVSCHQVGMAVWSHEEARAAGMEGIGPAIRALSERAEAFVGSQDRGRAFSLSQLLLARQTTEREGGNLPSLRDGLVEQQESDGRWKARGQFPTQRRPIAESNAIATHWAILALSDTPLASKHSQSRERAWRSLAATEPGTTTEWILTRLLVENRLGQEARATSLRDRLIREQNPDGGWGWDADKESEALSTGQVLYALDEIGEPRSGTTQRRARQYLLDTQREDGTWSVDSHLTSSKPSEGKDYVYTYWGTAWATIGLVRSLPVQP